MCDYTRQGVANRLAVELEKLVTYWFRKYRRSALKTFSVLLCACLVVAAEDLSWKSKAIGQWDAEDARQVLTESPWAKSVTPQWVRDLSPDERRQSGNWEADIPTRGVGLDGLVGIFSSAGLEEVIALSHAKPDPGTVLVRWESGRPVRVAEQMLAEPEVPRVDNDSYYAIAVYNIATPKRWNIEKELKGIAALKRSRKQDIKPSRTIILRKQGPFATVVYLFPRTTEITKKDGNVVFQAQIGRLVVTRIFSTEEMRIQGRLEL
jgi:hypothetical protein